MKPKIAKFVVVGFFVTAFSLIAQSAKALPIIDEINIPITSATFNSFTGDFTISGRPTSQVSFFYNDGRQPNPETFPSTTVIIFDLSTIGLAHQISLDGSTIEYSSTGLFGDISLFDRTNLSSILEGELKSLTMTIIDPGLGAFEGSGSFDVTGGSLANDFGANGGLATIGISFTVPADFNNSFAALANTKLFPDPPTASIPDASIMWLLGPAFIVLGVLGRRKSQGT
jgi:hypothetical protein